MVSLASREHSFTTAWVAMVLLRDPHAPHHPSVRRPETAGAGGADVPGNVQFERGGRRYEPGVLNAAGITVKGYFILGLPGFPAKVLFRSGDQLKLVAAVGQANGFEPLQNKRLLAELGTPVRPSKVRFVGDFVVAWTAEGIYVNGQLPAAGHLGTDGFLLSPDGKRLVLKPPAMVSSMTEEEFRAAAFPPGHTPAR